VVRPPQLIVVEPSENRREFFASTLSQTGYPVVTPVTVDEIFTTVRTECGDFFIVRLATLGRTVSRTIARAVLEGLRPIVLIPRIPNSTLKERLEAAGATAVVVGVWNVEGVMAAVAAADGSGRDATFGDDALSPPAHT
jgi:hypothetical protein